MVERIRRMVEHQTPFLIVKYHVSFLGMTNTNFDLVTMYGKKLQYSPMSRGEVMRVLNIFGIDKLYEDDAHDTIWGSKNFRDKFIKGKYKI